MGRSPIRHLVAYDEESGVWFFGALMVLKEMASGGQDIPASEHVAQPGERSAFETHAEDQIYYIVEGEMTFRTDNAVWTGGPRTSVFVPRGMAHGFRVTNGQAAHYLLMTARGEFDQFIRDLDAPANEWVIARATHDLSSEPRNGRRQGTAFNALPVYASNGGSMAVGLAE